MRQMPDPGLKLYSRKVLIQEAPKALAYAREDGLPKSHDRGTPVTAGQTAPLRDKVDHLLLVQGPLGLNWALGEGLRFQIGFDALRKEIARESRAVRDFSDECRFWVARRA